MSETQHAPASALEIRSIVFLGFGEVAEVFTEVVRSHGWEGDITVWLSGRTPSLRTESRLKRAGVVAVDDAATVQSADLVVSLVPPSQATAAARALIDSLASIRLYVDLTSIGPEVTSAIVHEMASRGVKYIKGSILGPVPVMGETVPIAIAGSSAISFSVWLRSVGFAHILTVPRVEDAASIKMLWSVITKGIIALFAESLVASERMGLLDQLLQLLRSQLGFFGSDEMVARLLLSNFSSGTRRLDEMAQVEATLCDLDVPAYSVTGTMAWLQLLATLSPSNVEASAASKGNAARAAAHRVSALLMARTYLKKA